MQQKGFTIIELIVVIAIIAVLATIVMINVTSYIAKSKDAAIKGNMSSIASTAVGYYDTNKNYTNLVNNTTVLAATAKITSLSPNATVISNDAAAWCVCANLVANNANSYCTDSTGYRGELNIMCSGTNRCASATRNACN